MKDEYSFFEKHYFYELERKQQLESNTSLPAAVIIAAFGLLGYFFTHFRFGGSEYQFNWLIEIAFGIGAFACALSLGIATYWCMRAVTGSSYEYLSGSETLLEYFRDTDRWHRAHGGKAWNEASQKDKETYLIEAMAHCNQLNWRTNLVRSEELFWTKFWTIMSLSILAFLAMCYYIDFWFDPVLVEKQ